MMKANPQANYVSICENKCVLEETESTASVAKCLLPGLSTTYSDSTFGIQKSHKLDIVEHTSSRSDNLATAAFDGNIHNTHSDTNSPCTIGMNFKLNHVAILDKIKIYLDERTPKTDFNGKLTF